MMNDRQHLQYLILDSTIEAKSRQTLRGIKENCSLRYRLLNWDLYKEKEIMLRCQKNYLPKESKCVHFSQLVIGMVTLTDNVLRSAVLQ